MFLSFCGCESVQLCLLPIAPIMFANFRFFCRPHKLKVLRHFGHFQFSLEFLDWYFMWGFDSGTLFDASLALFHLHKPWRRRQDLQGFSSAIAKSMKLCQVLYIFRWGSAVFPWDRTVFLRTDGSTLAWACVQAAPMFFQSGWIATTEQKLEAWKRCTGASVFADIFWFFLNCSFFIVYLSAQPFFFGFNCRFCFFRLFLHYFICKCNWQQGSSSATATILKLYEFYIFWRSAVFRPFLCFLRKKKPNSVPAGKAALQQEISKFLFLCFFRDRKQTQKSTKQCSCGQTAWNAALQQEMSKMSQAALSRAIILDSRQFQWRLSEGIFSLRLFPITKKTQKKKQNGRTSKRNFF